MSSYKKNIIYCEGQTEKKLLELLDIKSNIQVYNLIERSINSKLRTLSKTVSYNIVIIFDTDTNNFNSLINNIDILSKQKNVNLFLLQQTKNLEDELIKCSNNRNMHTLINSRSRSDFKADFCRCNNATRLINALNTDLLWNSALNNRLQQYNSMNINFDSLKKITLFKR